MFAPSSWFRSAVLAKLLLSTVLMSPLARAGEFPARSDDTAGANPATTSTAMLPVRASQAGVACGETITSDTTLV